MYIIFQSTPSSQKVTAYFYGRRKRNRISIHTFLTEGDKRDLRMRHLPHHFNPHLPHRRWRCFGRWGYKTDDFNPHLPHRRWLIRQPAKLRFSLFQSTPSSQKVTQALGWEPRNLKFQSAPSSQKVTDQFCNCTGYPKISIRTFLTEGDMPTTTRDNPNQDFNPHLPHRRWPELITYFDGRLRISIRTFLTEGDRSEWAALKLIPHFNPHLPHRRWRPPRGRWPQAQGFQSAPSSQKVTAILHNNSPTPSPYH